MSYKTAAKCFVYGDLIPLTAASARGSSDIEDFYETECVITPTISDQLVYFRDITFLVLLTHVCNHFWRGMPQWQYSKPKRYYTAVAATAFHS
jgi:hypothetical protein